MAQKRLLIFQESPTSNTTGEPVFNPVNKLGLPITGAGPDLPSLLDLPLRVLRAFTEIFNQPKYKGWAIVSAGPYKDPTVVGNYYAVVLEKEEEQSSTIPNNHFNSVNMGTVSGGIPQSPQSSGPPRAGYGV